METIKKALNILDNTTLLKQADIEKVEVYILLAIWEELQTLNQILKSKYKDKQE